MKKLICLVICIACLMTMLVSCGNTTCDSHIDEDINMVCDTCGIPMYTVVEKVPTEEEIVDMIVSAIPAGATLGSIWTLEEAPEAPIGQLVKVDALEKIKDGYSVPAYFKTEKMLAYSYQTQTAGQDTIADTLDDRFTDTTVIYNMKTNTAIYTYTTDAYSIEDANNYHVDKVNNISTLDNYDNVICVKRRDYSLDTFDNTWDDKIITEYYFATGAKIYSSLNDPDGEKEPEFNFSADFIYITVGNEKSVYDVETFALLGKGDKDTFINRPVFNFETDKYGYVKNDGKIFVFDLSKWIECVYSYEIPTNANVFYLANGNLLVQKTVTLPDVTKNYDYVDANGIKTDLKYFVIDVAAKTETEIEFGYYINYVTTVEDGDGYVATIKNILNVTAITNKNLGKNLKLACNDALAIVADLDDALPEFVGSVKAIADGKYLATVRYGEGSYIDKIFDATGAEIATVPNSATVHSTYIECDGSYYDFTMKLLLDLDADELNPYTVHKKLDSYVLLKKGMDIYYWNATLAAPVMVADATNADLDNPNPNPTKEEVVDLNDACDDYFIVSTTVTTAIYADGQLTTYNSATTVKVFNSENVCILTSDDAIYIEVFEDYVLASDPKMNVYRVAK